MKGDGFYDQNSSGQRAAIEALLPWIDRAAESVICPAADRPLILVDYGCSEGSNALRAMEQLIGALRRRGASNPLCPVLCDLPTNNFNQLFRNLVATGWHDSSSRGIYPSAVGGSFYQTLCPPGSVHLGMSFNSVLWMDRLPDEPLADFIVYLGPREHRADVPVPASVVKAYSQQAAHDLERFYAARANELAPGARLLVAQPGRDESYCTGEGLYDLLHDACRDLIEAGRLGASAYRRVTMPIYFRSLEELAAPVNTAAEPRSVPFEIEQAETMECMVPFAADYTSSGNLEEYVARYIAFAQAFTEPILRAGIDSAGVAAIYARMGERLRNDPAAYAFRYLQSAVLLTRR